MSEKKLETTAESVASAAAETKKAKSIKQAASKKGGFCIYLGPTITGVVQSGTIYSGSKKSVLERIGFAVEKYPLIASLVVSDKTIAEDRIKVKTPGNMLFVNYHKLASGRN